MTHRELVREELGESLQHLRQAAAHAVGGVGASVGPRVDSARDAMAPRIRRVSRSAIQGMDGTLSTLGPLIEAAREGAAQAGRATEKATGRSRRKIRARSRRRTVMVIGLLATGAAAGAAAATISRRNNRDKWEEYDAEGTRAHGIGQTIRDEAQSTIDTMKSAADKATERTAETIDYARSTTPGHTDRDNSSTNTRSSFG